MSLTRVGGPMLTIPLQMKPSQAASGVAVEAPLSKVGGALVQVPLVMKANQVLLLDLDVSIEAATDSVLKRLEPILELVRGCGFHWILDSSSLPDGHIRLSFTPVSSDHADKLGWLMNQLQPIVCQLPLKQEPVFGPTPFISA
jgi:hypothetical protein